MTTLTAIADALHTIVSATLTPGTKAHEIATRQIAAIRAEAGREAARRPAPEPTDVEIQDAMWRTWDGRDNMDAGIRAMIACCIEFVAAARRRAAPGVPAELLARLPSAEHPWLENAWDNGEITEDFRGAIIDLIRWARSQPTAAPPAEPPDLARLVEIGRKAHRDFEAGVRAQKRQSYHTDEAIEAIAGAILSARPADPLAPWVKLAKRIVHALPASSWFDPYSEYSLAQAAALVRDLAAAGGDGT